MTFLAQARKNIPLLLATLVLLPLSSCAVVGVKIKNSAPEERRELKQVLAPGGSCHEPAAWAAYARDGDLSSEGRLSAWLETARLALPGAVKGEREPALLYRAALRQIVEILGEKGFATQPEPGISPISRLEVARQGNHLLDPTKARKLIPADQIAIRGLNPRVTQEGPGLPMVAWYPSDSSILEKEPGVPSMGLAIPATALVTFSGSTARLVWLQTLRQDTLSLNGKRTTVAADFTAPLAYMLAHGHNRALDPRAMFRSDLFIDSMGLYQFQPYDPNKIPVVFVHGLLARPESWRAALNQLMADREIREKYQFWFFLYPTGLPVWASAAALRQELDRFQTDLEPRAKTAGRAHLLQNKVIIGHSMGGILSGLMIRDGGDALWSQFSDKPMDSLQVSNRTREMMQNLLVFRSRADVARVIFVATPHRGSPVAMRPISELGARLIRLPFQELRPERSSLLAVLRDDVRREMSTPANSLRFLRSESPLLLSILNLPRREEVPIHTIVGDRGRGNFPHGSDGIVPHKSSLLPDTTSEAVVPSGHGAHENSQGIQEIARILRAGSVN